MFRIVTNTVVALVGWQTNSIKILHWQLGHVVLGDVCCAKKAFQLLCQVSVLFTSICILQRTAQCLTVFRACGRALEERSALLRPLPEVTFDCYCNNGARPMTP